MMSCHVNDHYGCHKCHEGKNLFMEDLIRSFASDVCTFKKTKWKGLGPEFKIT